MVNSRILDDTLRRDIGGSYTSFEKQIFLKKTKLVREKRSQWGAIVQEEGMPHHFRM